jgi:hypothetical protein
MSRERHHIQYIPESPNVRMTFVGWSAFGTLLLLVVSIGGLFGIYHGVVPSRTLPAPQRFPSPRVDTRESEELRGINAAQKQKLETWKWSDNQRSLIQIPIERAMQLLAKKGAEAYEPLLPAQTALTPPTAAAEQAIIQQGKTAGAPTSTSPSVPETQK